jgi:hypothetical protein
MINKSPTTFKPKKNKTKKYNNEICETDMTFHDCELAILRHAVDENEKHQGQKMANSDEIKKIIGILENFLIEKKLVCYGGTAINNILPKYAQFYNKDIELPDYDFFSPKALEHAKELTDIYYKNGYKEVEAKSGMHYGTFKVFVNFIPIADITMLNPDLFKNLYKESISIAGIRYASPNFLRMGIYLELSRPLGDVSRWEKIYKRLVLLNKYYPFKTEANCRSIDFQRKMEDVKNKQESQNIYYIVRDSFIEQGVVFFGSYATSLYAKYTSADKKMLLQKIPDFDVITDDIDKCSIILKERLTYNGIKNVKIVKHEQFGEIIPEHNEIMIGKDSIACVYTPIACHNYNQIEFGNKVVNVATIDTIMSFYLAFIYSNEYSHSRERLLCMAKFLFEIQEKNRLDQKGILQRFNMKCVGKQTTLEEYRAEKSRIFKELAENKNSELYQMWFLKYVPDELKKSKENKGKKEQDESKETNETETPEEKPKKKKRRKTRKMFGVW